jgi:C-terminal processing protease CtpA/Prc
VLDRFILWIFAALALLSLTGCPGGGGGSAAAPTDSPPATDPPPVGFQPNVFEPSSNFKSLCAAPRTGIDPSTGAPFADRPGTFIDENNWLRSWSNELYLWYDEITDVDPASLPTHDYFAVMKTFAITPSGAPKDRFHSSLPTDEWLAQSQSGVSIGYGSTFATLSAVPPRQVVVAYTEPNSPATTGPANLVRGTLVLSVDGVDVANGANVDAINAGLFPSDIGESHTFLVQDPGAATTRTVTLVSAAITSDPVQNVGVVATATGSVGYMLFNDHIATSEQELIDAVNQLRGASIVDLVLDLRYNGGGLLAIASELAYMIAGPAAAAGKTFFEYRYNNKHPVIDPFTGQAIEPFPFLNTALGFSAIPGLPLPSLNLSRVFVLTGPDTCSASESIINSLRGIDIEVIQIGSTTCGKPYGFLPTDNCGTTYFSIQFKEVNAKGFGDYPDGFSPINVTQTEGVPVPGCSVRDDFTHALGDPSEARLAAALAYRVNPAFCPAPSGLDRQRSIAALSPPSLSAVDGEVPKSVWLTNRIMEW